MDYVMDNNLSVNQGNSLLDLCTELLDIMHGEEDKVASAASDEMPAKKAKSEVKFRKRYSSIWNYVRNKLKRRLSTNGGDTSADINSSPTSISFVPPELTQQSMNFNFSSTKGCKEFPVAVKHVDPWSLICYYLNILRSLPEYHECFPSEEILRNMPEEFDMNYKVDDVPAKPGACDFKDGKQLLFDVWLVRRLYMVKKLQLVPLVCFIDATQISFSQR